MYTRWLLNSISSRVLHFQCYHYCYYSQSWIILLLYCSTHWALLEYVHTKLNLKKFQVKKRTQISKCIPRFVCLNFDLYYDIECLSLNNASSIVLLTVSPYHVMYTFQSESTLYSCLNFKELLARSRHKIWSLSDCNWTRTQKHFDYLRDIQLIKNSVCI